MPGRIILGLGGTVDYELHWQTGALQALVDECRIRLAELEDEPPAVAHGTREMVLAILRSMRHGRGWECYAADRQALIDLAGRFERSTTLGGTCVRAALALARLGVPSTVHLVSMSPEVRRLLPAEVERLCSAAQDSLDPHVIVQYPRGAQLRLVDGTVRSSRPNRVILVNDEPNEHMLLAPGLARAVGRARAVLISGLNTMRSQAELRERLTELERILAGAPGDVIYEDAGFHDEAMRQVVLSAMPRMVWAHSLNEDEAQHYLGRSVDLEDPGQVVSMMRDLLALLGSPAVMVHTSGYAAVVGRDAQRLHRAAELGCLMASTRYLHGDAHGRAEYEAVRRAGRDPRGLDLARDTGISRAGVLIAPSFAVRPDSPTTIGLGDAFIGGVMGSLAGAEGL